MSEASNAPGLGRVDEAPAADEVGRVLTADIEAVKAARAYTVEHFGFSKTSFVGHMPSNDFDAAVDHIVDFAGWAVDVLTNLRNGGTVHEGLKDDIGYALGLIKRWRCECGDINGAHEAFCYRCGAGGPDA